MPGDPSIYWRYAGGSITTSTTGWETAANTLTPSNIGLWQNYNIHQLGRMLFTPIGTNSLYYHAIPTMITIPSASTTYAASYATYSTTTANSYWPPDRRPARIVAPVGPPALARPAVLSGRRALRRSLALFHRFRPATEIKTFLDGRPLIIPGHRFDYRLQKRGDLLQHTMNPNSSHIPYDLQLFDKSGQFLAHGCLVIPGTPVIDQMLALILHVQDVDEEWAVIRTTNWLPRLPAHLLIRDVTPMARAA
jgi:hypothetical protein